MDSYKDLIEIVLRLFVHMLCGVALFFMVLIPALLLGWIVEHLPDTTPLLVSVTMQVLEMLLFFGDVLLFAKFTWQTFKKTWDDL